MSLYSGFTEHVPWVGCRDINECTEGGSTCKSNTDCWNLYGSHNCTCMVGFTGDPFVGCVDIDECSLPELNTCPGGMNAGGFSHDVYIKDQYDYGTKYLWPVDSDGYSQVFM